jgi:hypothetical protein
MPGPDRASLFPVMPDLIGHLLPPVIRRLDRRTSAPRRRSRAAVRRERAGLIRLSLPFPPIRPPTCSDQVTICSIDLRNAL